MAAARGPSLGHNLVLAWADGGPILICTKCTACCRRVPKALEQECNPARARWRTAAKRLRFGQAPDTGSPLLRTWTVPAADIEVIRMLFLTFVNEDSPPSPRPDQPAHRQGPRPAVTICKRRLTRKTGPYGANVARRLRCKSSPTGTWHLYCCTPRRQQAAPANDGDGEAREVIPPPPIPAVTRLEALRQRVLSKVNHQELQKQGAMEVYTGDSE